MDMIEVDPKLFVTCRLCLEDMGQYQIVPIVQQQIKYCFDIDVEPFDGLPQLICVKCKTILITYHEIKKTMCEKQSNLRDRISKKDTNVPLTQPELLQPQQDTVSSSQPASDNIDIIKKPKLKVRRTIDSSDSETSSNAIISNKKSKVVKHLTKWDPTAAGYKKRYVCLICKSDWPNSRAFYNHNRAHSNLKKEHNSMFKSKCLVVLNKIDNKPNITGQNDIVAHSPNKLIQYCNTNYYFQYTKNANDSNNSENGESDKLYNKHVDVDSTDDEQEISAKPKRRKRQLLSRSSNDTVVIESNGNKIEDSEDEEDTKPAIKAFTDPLIEQNSNTQCISIDDSSDSDEDRQVESIQKKQPLEAKLSDFKVIHGIITMCISAHHRKNESVEKSDKNGSESHLKHKVLSIGRKIINKQGFNCNGILRYTEHKNLDIIWATKASPNTNSKESNYIRIMTKLRGTDSVDDNQGWEPVPPPAPAPVSVSVPAPVTLPASVPARIPAPVIMPDASLSVCRSMPPLTQNLNNTEPAPDSAILLICSPPDPKSKLLNANPVANPKQLPRKIVPNTDTRLTKSVPEVSATFRNNEENDASMPIITSTTSLAVPADAQNEGDSTPVVPSNTKEISAPRIKVKPAAELMSERVLNSLRNEQQTELTGNLLNQNENRNDITMSQVENTNNNLVLNQSVWLPQSMPNMYVSNVMSPLTVGGQQIQIVPLSCLTPQAYQAAAPAAAPAPPMNTNSKEDYVLLNTVELPNTKSNSPFNYLKKLLQMHNLNLLDPEETLSNEFVCLIKFKVQFKQDPIDEPVVLCLSLFCHKNQFCFKVKDRFLRNINISNVSPNWQWEILNVFRGDLVDKLLQNSQKHSQETHECTNTFLCLLKSIYMSKLR